MGILDRFRKPKVSSASAKVNLPIPEGLWIKCGRCSHLNYHKTLKDNLKTCTKCGYPFRLSAGERIESLVDAGSFKELDKDIMPVDPLHFKDLKSYRSRIREAQKETGIKEAIVTGYAKIGGKDVCLGIMDFNFMGGSMGSVVGEKVLRLAEKAQEEKLPLIMVCASGGARMQEGVLSLMQMAKISIAISNLQKEKILFITVLTDPTTGGVAASFAYQSDIVIAESQALIGFAGPRVIEQTIKQKLPEGFQRAEFLLRKGMVDKVVERKELKNLLIKILRFFNP